MDATGHEMNEKMETIFADCVLNNESFSTIYQINTKNIKT